MGETKAVRVRPPHRLVVRGVEDDVAVALKGQTGCFAAVGHRPPFEAAVWLVEDKIPMVLELQGPAAPLVHLAGTERLTLMKKDHGVSGRGDRGLRRRYRQQQSRQ